MTRNAFIKASAGTLAWSGALALQAKKTPAAPKTAKLAYTPLVDHDVPPRNRNPYKGLDWSKCHHVMTSSHAHCCNQKMLDVYLRHGWRFFTISNYYPSAPYCPAKDMTGNRYRVRHEHPISVNGRRTDGPFDWNRIVSEWKDELPEALQKELPFKESGRKLFNWPEGMLEAPNAEHHSFLLENGKSAGSLHICAPGSAFASGTFDAHDKFRTLSHGYHYGTNEFWKTSFDRMIAGLVDPEGGGITINHPRWSRLDRAFILEMLDHDPRVLGIEVLEYGKNSEAYWDWILSTGRQCFGVFVPDWGVLKDIGDFGANMLVVPEMNVHECLKAYRQGNFYGSLHARNELLFTHISFDGKTLKAATDKPARFEVVTALGIVQETKGTSMEWSVPADNRKKCEGPRVDIFARVRACATDGSGEILFSQPFMLY